MSWKKKLAIFITGVTMIVCAGLGFWLGVHYIAPAREYREAEAYIQDNQYDEAVVVFEKIAESYDTESWLSELLGFADAADRVTQTWYEKAVYLREQGAYEASAALFDELADYADSADQAANSRLLLAKELIESDSFEEAFALLESLDGYEDDVYGDAQELIDRAHYLRGGKLAAIGKLGDAESDYAAAESYSDAWENLREVRYSLARNALLIGDFDTAASYLEKITTYEDAADLLTVVQSAVDKVYETVYTDISGNTIEGMTSYLWVYTVVVPGRLDEGVSVQMLEDMTVGEEVDPAWFGAISYTYVLELVRDEDTWYFTYYGSDTENSEGALVLEAEFEDGYSALTTRKVYASVRDEEVAAEAEAAAEEAARLAEEAAEEAARLAEEAAEDGQEEDDSGANGTESGDGKAPEDETGETSGESSGDEGNSADSASDDSEEGAGSGESGSAEKQSPSSSEDGDFEEDSDDEEEDSDEEEGDGETVTDGTLDAGVRILEDEDNLAEGELDQEEEGDSGDEDGEERSGKENPEEEDEAAEEEEESAESETDSDSDEDREDDASDSEGSDRGPVNDHERTWTEVTDEELADLIRECFRTKLRLKLAESGNMAFSNSTSDSRLTHYCDVEYCLNISSYMAQDSTSRRYYCEEHVGEYLADPACTESEDTAE